jgi:SAM-dependent methyltransferase
MPWLKQGINRFIPSVTWQPQPPLPGSLQAMGTNGVILDIGAGGRIIGSRVWGVDFFPFANTRVVADIQSLPFAHQSVVGVICTGTLEHVEDPLRALDEMYRILQPGGIIHLEVPFMQPYHRDPLDYWRWTLDGLLLLARQRGFEEIQSGSHLRSQAAMNVLVIAYWQSWFRSRYIRKAIDVMLSWALAPLKYLDRLCSSKTRDIPSAVYFIGKKQDC